MYSATNIQRQEELESRNVEGNSCHGEKYVSLTQSRLSLHAFQKIDKRTMRYLHAFGSSSRTGGEDHISQLILRDGNRQIWSVLRCLVFQRVDCHDGASRFIDHFTHGLCCQHNCGLGIFKDCDYSHTRIDRVEGKKGGSRL